MGGTQLDVCVTHAPLTTTWPDGQTQAVPLLFGAMDGVHTTYVSTRLHSPFCSTMPGGQTLSFTHSLPSSTVPCGHMQVGVQALRQFGPTQAMGGVVVGGALLVAAGRPESATGVAQGCARIRM